MANTAASRAHGTKEHKPKSTLPSRNVRERGTSQRHQPTCSGKSKSAKAALKDPGKSNDDILQKKNPKHTLPSRNVHKKGSTHKPKSAKTALKDPPNSNDDISSLSNKKNQS